MDITKLNGISWCKSAAHNRATYFGDVSQTEIL